ncbi:MAG: lipopolysaccharide biosynthesis protein [Bacteroidaceae bacterium]|nr:lipopolysaccharide biosynthesis protein [Bacteroidaceae bacterium]
MGNENNKRIIKNSLYLYARMFILLAIGLYTSRIILETLGVNDYGIYNAVGGIVTVFLVIQATLSTSTQRYITYALGKNDREQLNNVFSTSVIVHILFSVILVILAETAGLWFLYNKMIIPEERMFAALWTYQCVIISTVVMIISVPYNALIIAHEKMGIYAKISLFEAFAKLLLVFIIKYIPYDKLIIYSTFLVAIQLIVRFIYAHYCSKNYKESKIKYRIEKTLIKEMGKFAAWSLFGATAFMTYTQGLNLLLNTFFGPAINAARGIAVQVQSHAIQFITGFQTAINPQITKSYAAGDFKYLHELIFRSSKFSYYLILAISLPIIIEAPTILTLWLGKYPDYSVIFIRIILASSIINCMANPLITTIKATGNVKTYECVVGGLMLTILPISYIFLKMGYPPYIVFIVHLVIEIIAQNARILIVARRIQLTYKEFISNIIVKVISVTVISSIIPVCIHYHYCHSKTISIINCMIAVASALATIYIIGLNNKERTTITRTILKKIKKNG